MGEEKYEVKYKSDLWKKSTIIKDAVHGYISIPKPIMREIIDTETFQRLKNIEQTGMEALYPSATHNRFTHSLGVYHLSKMSFTQFKKNVKTDFETIYNEVQNKFVKSADDVWHRWELMFQLASLLHDCGHSPFSHTLEFIYDLPVEKTLNDRLVENMSDQFKEDVGYNSYKATGNTKKVCGAPHERMSSLFIKLKGQDYFYDKVECLLKDYVNEFLPNGNVYEKNSNIFDDDIEFMIRMIIGCRYNFDKADSYCAKNFYDPVNNKCWYTELELRNCIINMLNSKLDVDNLDYVIRDSKYSGYANQNVDIERLLSSLTIVTAFELKDVRLKKEDSLNCCVNLEKFKGEYVDARISGACYIGSHSQDIKAHGKVYLEGEQGKSEVIQRSMRTGEHFSAQVTFPIEDVSEKGNEITIKALSKPDEEKAICYLNIRGCLEGTFTGTILKNEIEIPSEWEKSGKRRIFPAYYQNCMSVLMSAIEGSNFEKKWVYSHQISTFTNNYLNIYLLEKYAQILMNKESQIFERKLNELIEDLKKGLTETQSEVMEEVGERRQNLHDKIRANFLKDYDKIHEFLDDSADEKNIRDLSEIFDVLITYKKLFNKSHNGLEEVIEEIISEGKHLDDKRYRELEIFNKKEYLKLRGKETQYFWDIVAMCEHKTIMNQHFHKSSDEDLVALYKQEYLSPVEEDADIAVVNSHVEFSENYEYLIKRNFMRCMWKSYPEYQFYFQDWTDEEIAALNIFLEPHTVPAGFGYLVLSDMIGENRAGDRQKKFWTYLKEEYNLKRFVSVNQVIKTKQFTPYETYMKRNKQVVRLEDIGLFSSLQKEEEFRFFYYDQNPGGKPIDIVEILNWLRKEITESKKKDNLNKGRYEETDMKKDIVIRDNIYGNICIPYKIRLLVDCKEFQRLRRIAQLATAGQVFPGAVQNRFSHSLGVYHLMDKIVFHFEKKLRSIGYEDSIKEKDKDAILVAALLHDVGHGPFSHAFEDAGINRDTFSHEYWTKRIITSQETDINQTLQGIWGEDFPDLVMSYIDCRNEVKDGKFEQNRYSKDGLNLKFIFASLVSSQLDADRMDYLLRDSRACGVTYGQFDLDRLIEGMSIAINSDGELKVGVEEEYISNVEEYFYARYLMYNNIYYHPFKVLTEKLLQDILREACDAYIKGALKSNELPPILAEIFNHATMSLEDFCDLDDHVVMGAMQVWANLNGKGTERLAILCQYFLNRRGFQKLDIINPKAFLEKLSNATKSTISESKLNRNDFIYCQKRIQMYKTDKKGDVHIIKANGTIVRIQDIKSMINLENEEDVLYHSMELTEKFYSEDKQLIEQLTREFSVNNSVEIEKKYVLREDADKDGVIQSILNIAKQKEYCIEIGELKKQEDVYFDTDNGLLKKNDFSVRIRSRGNQKYITCKYNVVSESNGEGGQLERYEAERIVASDDLISNKEHIDISVPNLLETEGYGINDLLPRVKVINTRQKYVLYKNGDKYGRVDERYELVLDDVTYQNMKNTGTAKEVQIEIELKSGYETRINMKELTDAIETIEGVTSITQSKYTRALTLTEGTK